MVHLALREQAHEPHAEWLAPACVRTCGHCFYDSLFSKRTLDHFVSQPTRFVCCWFA